MATRRLEVLVGVIGEAGQTGPVGVHHVDLEVDRIVPLIDHPAGACGDEGDARPIGRPGEFRDRVGVVSESSLLGAIGIHDEDAEVVIAVGDEGDTRAVGRPGGNPGPTVGESGEAQNS